MFKNTIKISLIVLTLLLLASCASSRDTYSGAQIITVPDRQAARIAEAVNTRDNSERLRMIREIQDYASSQDPVFNNVAGSAMLIEGEYEIGIAMIRESVRVLLREDLLYMNLLSMPEVLAYAEQNKEARSISIADNQEVVAALREYVQSGRDRSLLRAIERWPGSLSVPPVLGSGLPSLALETMNDAYGSKIINAQSFSYFNPHLNLESQRMRALERASRNLLMGGVLSGDEAVVREAVANLQSIPTQYQTSESRFLTGLGLYLIRDERWRNQMNQRYIAMFRN